MKNTCPNCQAANENGAKYCSVCGHELSMPQINGSRTKSAPVKSQKNSYLQPILIFVVCFAAAYFGTRYFMKPSLDKELQGIATELNKKCPMKVDEYTTLNKVQTFPGKIIQYNYALTEMTKAEVNLDTVKKYIFPELLKNAKENPQMKSFRDNDVTVKYNYTDKNGVFVTEYVIKPEMY